MLKSIRCAVAVLSAAAVLAPSSIGAYAADTDRAESADTAYYNFAAGGDSSRITAEMMNKYDPNIVTKDGREGWQLDNSQGTTEAATISCNIDSSFAYDVSDGSVFEIEIDYFDTGKAVFSMVYSAQDRSDRFAGSVRTDGVGSKETESNVAEWKTAVFRIEDAKFNDSLNGCDFQISANILDSNHGITTSTLNGFSPNNDYGLYYSSYYIDTFGRVSTVDPIVIGAVRVKKLETKNPFTTKVTMDTTSNTLFDSEHAKFNYSMKNNFDTPYELGAEYTIYDENDREVLTKTETVSVAANEEKTFSVDLGEVPYGLFYLKTRFTADGVESEIKTEFSHSREVKVANERVGTNVHFEGSNMYKNDVPKIMELAAKSGMSTVRDSARWDAYERVKGKYEIPEQVQQGKDEIEKWGLDTLQILSGENPLYGDFSVASTPEELEGFKNYSRYVAEQYRDDSYAIEAYNEYNIHHPEKTAEEYVALLKATYEGVKEGAPDMKVIGVDSAGLSLSYLRSIFEAGGLEYMDGVSYHPYYHSRGPETSGVISNGLAVKSLLEEFGKPDAEIWITENGWPTWLGNPISYDDQAVYHVTTILENAAWQLFDKYIFYECANSGVEQSYMESQFGMVKSVYDDVPYAAKPAYVAVCNANYQLQNTEFKDALGGLSTTAENFAYRFTRDSSDGKGGEMIALWTINADNRSEMGIDLGCDKVTMYDFYGNETELYGINGKFSFAATDKPVYIVGDFNKFESCEPPIKVNSLVLGGAPEDTVAHTVTMPNSEGAQLVQEGSTFFGDAEMTGFENGTANFTLHTPEYGFFDKSAAYRIEKDGKIYYHGSIYVKSVSTATVSVDHKVCDGDLNRWQLKISLTNNRNSTPISGTIKINDPDEFASAIAMMTVRDLKPQETRVCSVFLPEIVTKEMRDFAMQVDLSTGETMDLEEKMFFTVVPYAGEGEKPVIDGKVSPGEYSSETWLELSGADNVMLLDSNTTYMGSDDLSAKATMKYDEDNLYMFIEVTDNIFCNESVDSQAWDGDGVQLGIAAESVTSGSTYCELGIALTPDGPQMYRYLTNNSKQVGMVNTGELQIVRDGTKTRYEFAVPWEEILPDKSLVKSGYRPKFAFLINEDDGLGRNSYMEYSQVLGAIGTNKNVAYFSDMNLAD